MPQDDQRPERSPVTADLPEDSRHGRRPTTDRVVFGVTAVLTLAFVLWGSIATDSLESVSSDLLGGLIHNGGWAFMLAASGFVVFALWLAISRYGRISLGQEGEEPEFRTVSWVAMMFSAGDGHRPDVLRGERTAGPLHRSAAGYPPRRRGRGDADRHGHHPLPLDAPPLGDLRRRRARHRVQHLPAAPSGRRSAPSSSRSSGSATPGAVPAGSSTSSRSSRRSSAPQPPSAWARSRSAAGSTSSTGGRRRAPACWSPSSPC